MADYESLRLGQVASMLERMPAAFERMTWPEEQLRRERETQLRALLAHAKARSPWHARRLAGIDCERIGEADLARLPVMTKDDLMESFDEIVTDRRLTRDLAESHLAILTHDAYLLDEYHVCASGGSSGRRGVFIYDRAAWTTCFVSYIRFNQRRMMETLEGEAPSIALIAADKASHMTAALGQTFAPPTGILRLPATLPLAQIVARLNEAQPNFVSGYATLMHQLALEARAGRLRIAPKLLGTMSEPLLPEMRAALGEVWGAPIYNSFGASEGLMGGSCGADRGIHMSDDLFVIEPVDARGDPTRPGERAARVLLTNLFNFTEPLIRYELTDELTVIDEPCPCGITLVRIEDIQGRVDDCFVYAGEVTVHPFTFRTVLGRERGIVEYQVAQTARGADVHIVTQGAVDGDRLASVLGRALADLGVAGAEVSVTPVASLGRQASGKLRRFVPLS